MPEVMIGLIGVMLPLSERHRLAKILAVLTQYVESGGLALSHFGEFELPCSVL